MNEEALKKRKKILEDRIFIIEMQDRLLPEDWDLIRKFQKEIKEIKEIEKELEMKK